MYTKIEITFMASTCCLLYRPALDGWKTATESRDSEPGPERKCPCDLLSINHFLKKILENIFKEIYQNQLQQVSEAWKP